MSRIHLVYVKSALFDQEAVHEVMYSKQRKMIEESETIVRNYVIQPLMTQGFRKCFREQFNLQHSPLSIALAHPQSKQPKIFSYSLIKGQYFVKRNMKNVLPVAIHIPMSVTSEGEQQTRAVLEWRLLSLGQLC